MYLKSILSLCLSLVAFLAPACSTSQVRVDFIGSQRGNHMEFDYDLFTGHEQKTFDLEQGQTMDLDYDLQVESGSLTLQFIDNSGMVSWEESFQDDAAGSATLNIDRDGLYKLSVSGEKAKGGFEIDWDLH